MVEMVSFRWQYGDAHIVCALHSKRSPSDEEWEEYLGHIQAARELLNGGHGGVAGLAVTDGGAPNAAQRKRLAEIVRGWEPIGAVVSESLLVHGIVTALSWLGMRVRVFAVTDVTAALRWAGLPDQHREALLAEIRARAKTVDGGVSTAEKLAPS